MPTVIPKALADAFLLPSATPSGQRLFTVKKEDMLDDKILTLLRVSYLNNKRKGRERVSEV
jgi:hypothetical protein